MLLGWLGWDHEASWDAIAGVEQNPYTTLQVAGCVLNIAVVTFALAAWRQPLASAFGVTLGFVLPWSVEAAQGDDRPLAGRGCVPHPRLSYGGSARRDARLERQPGHPDVGALPK